MKVIPTFDPFERSHLGFRLSFEPTTVQKFALERSKETLGHGGMRRPPSPSRA